MSFSSTSLAVHDDIERLTRVMPAVSSPCGERNNPPSLGLIALAASIMATSRSQSPTWAGSPPLRRSVHPRLPRCNFRLPRPPFTCSLGLLLHPLACTSLPRCRMSRLLLTRRGLLVGAGFSRPAMSMVRNQLSSWISGYSTVLI